MVAEGHREQPAETSDRERWETRAVVATLTSLFGAEGGFRPRSTAVNSTVGSHEQSFQESREYLAAVVILKPEPASRYGAG